ncbi:MAG: hypothetical protein V7699_01625 [Porticoccus sp.]
MNIDDRTEEALAATKQNPGSPFYPQSDTSKTISTQTGVLEKLRALSINSHVDEMRKTAKNAIHIAGRMALAGQITVFFAGPNTGKTLITLKLIAEAVANGTAGKNVYHINLDDTYEGLITKADIGNRHGVEVLTQNKFPSPNENFAELVAALVKEDTASETVFIMDTIKKFVDVMDKKASSQFMNTCRKLTSAGGSIIALAHTNKNKDGDNKAIPAGTSDVLDDCDCAYVMDIVDEQKVVGGTMRTVEFRQEKSRGPVVQEALYSYTKYDDSDYERMFYSVKLIDGNEADLLRARTALNIERDKDANLIKVICDALKSSSEWIQKDLVIEITNDASFPRRKVHDCLKRWSCPADEGGLWAMSKGPHNSNIFKLNQ